MDVAAIVFNSAKQAVFINPRAALALDIRNRMSTELYSTVLSQFANCIEDYRSQSNHSLDEFRYIPAQELSIETESRRRIVVLIRVGRVDLRPFSDEAFTEPYYVVSFYELTMLEPFFHMLSQARKNRSLLVSEACEKENRSSENGNTELLKALTLAIELVDALVLPNIKILLDVKVPALLSISVVDFLRIISHLLLEAADYVGPFGVISVSTVIQDDSSHYQDVKSVDIIIRAERKYMLSLDSPSWELYLYKKYMPVHYKVQSKDWSNISSEHLEPHDSPTLEIHLGQNTAVASQLITDNMKIVVNLIRNSSIFVELKRTAANELLITAHFPLLK